VIEIGRVTMGVSEKERERERETHLESETPPDPRSSRFSPPAYLLTPVSVDTSSLVSTKPGTPNLRVNHEQSFVDHLLLV